MQPAPRYVQAAGRVHWALPASGICRPERPEAQATPIASPPLRPAPPRSTPSARRHPKGEEHRGPPAERRVGGWGGGAADPRERGSDRADRVGDPAPGCCGDTRTLWFDNQIKLRVKLRRKVSRSLFASSCTIETDSMSFNGDNN